MSDDLKLVRGLYAKPRQESDYPEDQFTINIKLADFAAYLRDLKKADPDVEWLNTRVKRAENGKWWVKRIAPKTETAETPEPSFAEDIPF